MTPNRNHSFDFFARGALPAPRPAAAPAKGVAAQPYQVSRARREDGLVPSVSGDGTRVR